MLGHKKLWMAGEAGEPPPPVGGPYVAAVKALNPLAYFRFREASGSTVLVDEMGNYNGIINDPNTEYLYQQQSLIPSEPDGNSLYTPYQAVTLPFPPTTPIDSIISKLATMSTGSIIFTHEYGATAVRGYGFGATNNNGSSYNRLQISGNIGSQLNVVFDFNGGGAQGTENFAVRTVDIITGSQIVVVQDDIDVVKVYQNGVAMAIETNYGTPNPRWFADLPGLAKYSPTGLIRNDGYNGLSYSYIGEHAIYETQLTAQDALDLYNASQVT